MQEAYIVYRIEGSDKYVEQLEPVKPTSLPANYGYVHWVARVSGNIPPIWESADTKKRRIPEEFWEERPQVDDPPFVDSRTPQEQRRCGFIMEVDELQMAYNASLLKGQPDNETNDDRTAYLNARAEIESKYPIS